MTNISPIIIIPFYLLSGCSLFPSDKIALKCKLNLTITSESTPEGSGSKQREQKTESYTFLIDAKNKKVFEYTPTDISEFKIASFAPKAISFKNQGNDITPGKTVTDYISIDRETLKIESSYSSSEPIERLGETGMFYYRVEGVGSCMKIPFPTDKSKSAKI